MASVVGDKGKSIFIKFADDVRSLFTPEQMEQDVKDDLFQKERKKRREAWAICYENLQKLNNELNKINRSDVKTYASVDSAAEEHFSSGRIDEIKKLKEKIEKYENALRRALEGDMKHVYELNQQSPKQSDHKDKGGGGGKSAETTAEGSS